MHRSVPAGVTAALLAVLVGCAPPGDAPQGGPTAPTAVSSAPTAGRPSAPSGTPTATGPTSSSTASPTTAPPTTAGPTPAGPPTSPPPTVGARPGRGRPIRLVSPAYDAPGAVIPVVVTAGQVPPGADVRFAVSAAGVPGECAGLVWRHTTGISQRCWATLPRTAGPVTLTATGSWAAQGDAGSGRVGTSRRIQARGPVTSALPAGEREGVERCGNATPRVWLTFDDYFADRSRLEAMLTVLRGRGVKARFFPMGGWARAHPDLVGRVRAAGHDIGNHTLSHEPLNQVSDAELNRQIAGGPETSAPHQLRPGFGAGAFTTRVRDAAAVHGQSVCYWTTDLRDWSGESAADMTATALAGNAYTPPVTPGGIVLLHMTGRHTTMALPGIIDGLRARGLELEPLPPRP